MGCLRDDIRAVLWIASVPAVIAVALLIVAVHEPAGYSPTEHVPLRLVDAQRLPRRYWLIVALGSVFTLARFSEAFLVLRAQSVGLAIGAVPVVMIVMNVVYAGTAYPSGIAADRFSRRTLLVVGIVALVAADLVLAAAATPALVFGGAAFWGLHMGLTQGLFSKLVADASPADLRGSAFGIFNLVSGGALLLASVIAGALWNTIGAPATFLAGAGFAAVAAIGLLAYRSTGDR
jgi:MFS family permease